MVERSVAQRSRGVLRNGREGCCAIGSLDSLIKCQKPKFGQSAKMRTGGTEASGARTFSLQGKTSVGHFGIDGFTIRFKYERARRSLPSCKTLLASG